jgi:PAS domain S-box-containing protein
MNYPWGMNRNILHLASLFLLATGFYVWLVITNNNDISRTGKWIEKSHKILKQTNDIQISIAEAESAVRGFVISKDNNWKIRLSVIHSELDHQIGQLSKLTEDNPRQQKSISNLLALVREEKNFQNELINSNSLSQEQIASINYKSRGMLLSNAIKHSLNAISNEEDRVLSDRISEKESSSKKDLYTTIIAGLITVLIVLSALVQINNENKRRLQAENDLRKSENRYRTLIEDSTSVMYTTDLQGKFTFVSKKCLQLTGFNHEEMIGRHFTELISPEWVNDVAHHYYMQFKKNIAETSLEFPIITRNGTEKWIEQVAVLINENYFPVGFQCMVRDISDKKEAQLRLEKSEELIQTVLNNIEEGFFMVNKDLQLMTINKKAREYIEAVSGIKAVAGMDFISMVPKKQKTKAISNFENILEGYPVEFESRYNTNEGPKWFKIHYTPVRDNGNIIGAAGVIHDITLTKLAEEKVKKANQKIKTLLLNSQEAFFMLSKKLQLITINEAGRKMLEAYTYKTANEGDLLLDFIPAERKSFYLNIAASVLKGNHEETEISWNTADGERYIYSYCFPVFSERNEVTGIFVLIKDVTEQKLAQEIQKNRWPAKKEYLYKAG